MTPSSDRPDSRVPTGWDRRSRNLVLLAIVALVLLGGAIAAERYKARRDHFREEWQRAGTEWYQYSRCMLGDKPLAQGETVTRRLRALWLATHSLNRGVPPLDQGSMTWPDRCLARKTALLVALRESGAGPGRAETLAALQAAGELNTPEGLAPYDELFSRASALGLPKPSFALDIALPPTVRLPLRATDLIPASELGTSERLTAQRPKDVAGPLRVLLDGTPGESRLCGFDLSLTAAPLQSATCSALVRKPSEVTADSNITSGALRSDGSILVVERSQDSSLALVLLRDGKSVSRQRIEAPPGAQVEVVGDWLVVQGQDNKNRARLIGPEGTLTNTTLPLPDGTLVGYCSQAQPRAVVVESDEKTGRLSVLWQTGDSWSPALETQGGGERQSLHCRPGELSLVWTDTDYSTGAPYHTLVHRTLCRPEGCTHSANQGPATIEAEGPVRHVLDLGKAVAVVWGRKASPMRLMVAPIERMDRAADVVVTDDERFGGLCDRGFDIEKVLERRGVGVVLARNLKHLFAIRLTAEGEFSPVRIAK